MNRPASEKTPRSTALANLSVLLTLVPLAGCSPSREPVDASTSAVKPTSVSQPTPASPVEFADITESAGIKFKHFNGTFGKKWMPETTGGGGAFIDYDKDGWEDILLVNSGQFNTPA